MNTLTIFVLAALSALAASQSPAPSGANSGQDDPNFRGTQPQDQGRACGDLTPDNCKFLDEAIQHCQATCPTRQNQTPQPNQNQNNNQKPGKHGKRKGGGCFHGDDVVQTKEHGTITMSELAKLRDAHVLARNDDGQLEYSSVRYWLHSQPTMSMKFMTLRTESGHQLSITGEHLIYETDCQGSGSSIFAKNVQVGRCLYVKENGKLSESPVVEKGHVRLTGIYAPITKSGSIVVNDVLASCFTNFEDESLQKVIYQLMISFQDALFNYLPTSMYEAAFNSQKGAVVAIPRLIYNILELSNYFLH